MAGLPSRRDAITQDEALGLLSDRVDRGIEIMLFARGVAVVTTSGALFRWPDATADEIRESPGSHAVGVDSGLDISPLWNARREQTDDGALRLWFALTDEIELLIEWEDG